MKKKFCTHKLNTANYLLQTAFYTLDLLTTYCKLRLITATDYYPLPTETANCDCLLNPTRFSLL